MSFPCDIIHLGLVDYEKAYAFQKECVQKVLDGESQKLIFCEHPPVLTLGRMSKESNFLWDKSAIEQKGVRILPIDRGGEVTLHNPGQLIVYPILNLNYYEKDLKFFLEKLEKIIIDVLKRYMIEGRRIEGKTGVWVGKNKIASLGVGVRKWVTFHGLGLNVNNDLRLFSMIRPCGMDIRMTSVTECNKEAFSQILGTQHIEKCNTYVTPLDIREAMWHAFKAEFDLSGHFQASSPGRSS